MVAASGEWRGHLMGYALGVDLGTTYTAAAVWRDGRVEIASLGNRAAAIPSVVLLREDETILTGDAASRRGASEPDRVAREFKRRVGDTTPIFLGGAPYSAEVLMAKLLRWTVDEVAKQEGGPADHLAVSHPANWGPYKKDLLGQAIRIANLEQAKTISEPEAAAIHYASNERVDPGDVVAVFDLGGGTFDAAVLRKTQAGFEILGAPEGIERLGGIDFDAAVFAHVARTLDGALERLDEDDPAVLAAVARLRQECVDAKEALSTDTDVSIPVLLPDLQTEVRLTRTEFEAMVRPSLAESIDALRRAVRSARVEPGDVKAVLLVGGSSRIPLVGQLVGAELGRPVAVDAHPKHAVALGAAIWAAEVDEPHGEAAAAAAAGTAAAAAAAGAAVGLGAAAAGAADTEPAAPAASPPEATQPIAATQAATTPGAPPPPGAGERFFLDGEEEEGGEEPARRDRRAAAAGGGGGGKSRRTALVVAALVLLAALVLGGGVLLASSGGGGNGDGGEEEPVETDVTEPPETEAPETEAPQTTPRTQPRPTTAPTTTTPPTTAPATTTT